MHIEINDLDPENVLAMMENGTIPNELIPRAIVRVGKPFDTARNKRAAKIIAAYLDSPDSLTRHEAIWFLGCWAKSTEFKPDLIRVLRNDPDPDIRGFAATCLGALSKGSQDVSSVNALVDILSNEREEEHVRIKAYAGLLNVAKEKQEPAADEFEFSIGRKSLKDVDWDWVKSLTEKRDNPN